MLAIGMLRGKQGVHTFEIPTPEISAPDEVLIRVKEVGLDGSDFNAVRYGIQDIVEGRNEITLGHEAVGVVEAVGSQVKTLVPGDFVVTTVRRGCGQCEPCEHNESDMCMTGLFTERGIHKLDGFLTSFTKDKEQYVVKAPSELARLAVFTEPLSIVEKGVQQLRVIQSRLPWFCPHSEHGYLSPEWGGCKAALVVGAGSLGLLATALLRLANVYTYVADLVPPDHLKARLAREMGAVYLDVSNKTPEQTVEFCCTAKGELDIIFEASGAAEMAIRLIPFMSPSSIYVMTGIPRENLMIQIDAAKMIRQIVRDNEVLVGSVNSNRSHFEMALSHMPELQSRFHGVLTQMITRRYHFDQYEEAFSRDDPDRVKTVIEIDPW